LKITAIDLVKIYRHDKRVVNGVSLEVEEGEVVGLLGPNGAGKTTMFYMIVGLVKPNSGRVMLDNEDITRQPMYQRARAGISYLPQETSVFRNLTVEENLMLVIEMQDTPRASRKARAEELMESLHITHKRDSLGKTLSGGEKRRVEIARALAAKPRFILLDEPFTGVDPKAIEDIEVIIQQLSREQNIGILITDHHVEAMLRITERAYIMAEGVKRYEGTSDQLLGNSEARAFYFGERYGMERPDTARQAAEDELRKVLDADPPQDQEADQKRQHRQKEPDDNAPDR
jgi:lipopolysaccharide export system ATP-binding protein